MKRIKGIISLAMALLLLLGTLAACTKDKNKDKDKDGQGSSDISFSDYAMIRPDKASGNFTKAASELYMALTEVEGCEITLATDRLTGDAVADSAAKEILVGVTNRPESVKVLSDIAADEFCIAVVGNKIVITGYTNETTYAAIEHFKAAYLGEGATLSLPSDLFYKGKVEDAKVIIDKNTVNYKIVRSATANKELLSIISNMCTGIYNQTGIYMNIGTDKDKYDPQAYEIIIGDTSYPETDEIKSTVGPDDCKVKVVGNKIVVFSYTTGGYAAAVDSLTALFNFSYSKNEAGQNTLAFTNADYEGKYGAQNYYTKDVPFSANGVYFNGTYDAYDNTMMIYWEEATEAMFDSYCQSLQANGYTAYQTGANNASIVAKTYTKNSGMVHVYLYKRTGEMRVITQDNAVLPINEGSYKKVCDPVIVQIGTDYAHVANSSDVGGMGYVIRLSDGTFVVIDGGFEANNDAKNIYDTMNSLKPEGMDIIVTAWFLTHGHHDHYGALNRFQNDYANKVTVKYFIGNDLSNEMYPKTDMGGRAFNFNSMKGRFGGCQVIKGHTGMSFDLPGVKLTILSTHEDYYPHEYDSPVNEKYNSFASTIILAESDSGKRAIFLGDIESFDDHTSLLVDRYGSDLKCDIMQVAHHGVDGGSLALYKKIDPDIALYPAKQSLYNSYKNLEQNKWVVNNCTVHFSYKGNKQLDFK